MIQIYVTGGTFDKEYNELNGTLFFKETHLHEMLVKGRSRLDLQTKTLFMKDSLDFTDTERKLIGDAMTQTAEYLAQQITDKTIVLTGAMVPYKFGSSDGMFNLGSALAFVQMLPPGVYISMNGKCFKAGEVRKNLDRGEFEAI
jgi:L-asparaginase